MLQNLEATLIFSFSSVLTKQTEFHTLQAYMCRWETQSVIAAYYITHKIHRGEFVWKKKGVECDPQEETHVGKDLEIWNNHGYYFSCCTTVYSAVHYCTHIYFDHEVSKEAGTS